MVQKRKKKKKMTSYVCVFSAEGKREAFLSKGDNSELLLTLKAVGRVASHSDLCTV